MVTSFGLLFRPSSYNATFRIKEKAYSHLNTNGKSSHSLYIDTVRMISQKELGETKGL